MRTKYKYSFDAIKLKNRWAMPYYQRNGDWLILGISKHYFSSSEFEYRIAIIGFEIHLWLKRSLKYENS
jgi:hypothetical protein